MIARCTVLCCGQTATDMVRLAGATETYPRGFPKANEIAAVPKLLAMFSPKGTIITAEAPRYDDGRGSCREPRRTWRV